LSLLIDPDIAERKNRLAIQSRRRHLVTFSIDSPDQESSATSESVSSISVVVPGDEEAPIREPYNVTATSEPDPEITRVVERLRKTQALENAEAEAEGRRIGSTWAKKTATARELKDLAVGPWERLYVRWQPPEGNSIWDAIDRGHDPSDFEGDDGRVENWLTVAFTRGVLLGARDVYRQVGHLI